MLSSKSYAAFEKNATRTGRKAVELSSITVVVHLCQMQIKCRIRKSLVLILCHQITYRLDRKESTHEHIIEFIRDATGCSNLNDVACKSEKQFC